MILIILNMKAIQYSTYGPPETLQIRDKEKPAPGDNEVLINVHATTVSSGDVKLRSFDVGQCGCQDKFYLNLV